MLLVEFRCGFGLFLSLGLLYGTGNKVLFVYPMDDALDCRIVLTISVGLFRFPRIYVSFLPSYPIDCWHVLLA